MEPLEFLGGKYHQPEQMVPGVVETFKAKEKSSGRAVFVHRVSTAKDDSQQAALLRLLLQALYRSPSAKALILDYTQDGDFFYVVTESVPQCMLLREWLQFEIDHDNASAEPPKVEAVKPIEAAPVQPERIANPEPIKVEAAKAEPQKVEPPPTEPGEFTRMFQAASPSTPETPRPSPTPVASAPPPPFPELQAEREGAGEFTRMFQTNAPVARPVTPDAPKEPVKVAAPPLTLPQQEPTPSDVGEFTRMFQTNAPGASPVAADAPEEPVKVAPKPALPQQEAAPSGPGEFTRMFQTGTPVSPSPSVSQAVPASSPAHEPEKTPPSAPSSSGPGEFTRFFQGGLPPSANQAPVPSNFQAKQDRPSDRPSNPGVQRPSSGVQRPTHSPVPPSAQRPTEPGEFTRMFSRPQAPTPGGDLGSRKPEMNDPFAAAQMPGLGSQFASSTPSMPAAPSVQEPGEYTRMFGKGNLPSAVPQAPVMPQPSNPLFADSPPLVPPATPAAPLVAKGPSEYTRVMQGLRPTGASPSAAPLASTQAPGTATPPAAAVPPPVAAGSGAKPAPAASNQKLIIFLAVLGVVTVILILVVVLIALKK